MKILSFTLTRKNQKGQVAIFVALIFQVIFVFFALLVNVGLLVHHKINLQQSTDLAAYYGAMKQAESLNAMAHVNFQIRQAWKLLTWRYRVLGTFGNESASFNLPAPVLPVTLGPAPTSKVNSVAVFESGKCPIIPPNTSGANTADTPFFCIGHEGFKGWPANENVCKVNCKLLNNQLVTVTGVSNPPLATQEGNAAELQQRLAAINTNLTKLCEKLAGENARVLAQFILSYRQEMKVRSQTMMMLAGNLSNSSENLLDLDGNKVLDGLTNTLKNNLTEANVSGSLKINSYNGLSDSNCIIDPSQPGGKKLNKREFVKRIEFDFINFFQHSCLSNLTNITPGSAPDLNYNPGSIYDNSLRGLSKAESIILPGGLSFTTMKINAPIINAAVEQEIMKLISNDGDRYSIGYEKDPWCPAYFLVQATTSPRIPFLPLSEIKLSAVSVAKPFGGSIGPWFGKSWDSGAYNSQNGLSLNDEAKQLDATLPANNRIGPPPTTLKDNSRMLMNFARFVGDTKGVSDPQYLAEYHGALINRKPNGPSNLFGASNNLESVGNNSLSQPTESPSLTSWANTIDFDNSAYDPLVVSSPGKDSFLRNLEISVLAPNQFDITYYSIDADYYNNYYKRLSNPKIFYKLQASSGNLGPAKPEYVRPDFGNNKNIYPQKEDFAVRNQIEIVKKVFLKPGFGTGLNNAAPRFIDVFPELVKKQSSLLTGWTFSKFTDFQTFPGKDFGPPEDTMNFARCKDAWQDVGGQPVYDTPKDILATLPATPGNCVTGGRVGYSVKIVSPNSLSATPQSLGGDGVGAGPILNPIPSTYLNNFP